MAAGISAAQSVSTAGGRAVGDVGHHQKLAQEAEDRDQPEDPQILPPERGKPGKDGGERSRVTTPANNACQKE